MRHLLRRFFGHCGRGFGFGQGGDSSYRLPMATPAYVGASYGNGGGNENVWRVMGAVEF
jgi:hypothetical protein